MSKRTFWADAKVIIDIEQDEIDASSEGEAEELYRKFIVDKYLLDVHGGPLTKYKIEIEVGEYED